MSKKNSSFKDLEIWRKSSQTVVDLYRIFKNKKVDEFQKELMKQIFKTCISVPNNIAEGFERQGNKEFKQFLFIAKGSNGELLNQAIIASQIEIFDSNESEALEKRISDVSRMTTALINYLKQSDYTGSKFVKEPLEEYGSKKSELDLTNLLSEFVLHEEKFDLKTKTN